MVVPIQFLKRLMVTSSASAFRAPRKVKEHNNQMFLAGKLKAANEISNNVFVCAASQT